MHFYSGSLIILFIEILHIRKKWVVLFVSLLSYEIVEICIRYIALNVFLPETIKDQFTDIFVGMLGGFIISALMTKARQVEMIESRNRLVLNIDIICTSFFTSFLWVGSYGYRYSIEFFNSIGINYTAFLLWWTGIMIFGKIYYSLKSKQDSCLKVILLSWGIYFVGLCLLEYFFYHILRVREIGASEHKAMLFDIVHGTTALHIFYLVVPFVSIAFLESINKLLHKVLAAMRGSLSDPPLSRH